MIAEEVQKKTLAKDMRMHYETLMSRVSDPGSFRISELAALSDLIEIEHGVLLEMADRLRKKGKNK